MADADLVPSPSGGAGIMCVWVRVRSLLGSDVFWGALMVVGGGGAICLYMIPLFVWICLGVILGGVLLILTELDYFLRQNGLSSLLPSEADEFLSRMSIFDVVYNVVTSGRIAFYMTRLYLLLFCDPSEEEIFVIFEGWNPNLVRLICTKGVINLFPKFLRDRYRPSRRVRAPAGLEMGGESERIPPQVTAVVEEDGGRGGSRPEGTGTETQVDRSVPVAPPGGGSCLSLRDPLRGDEDEAVPPSPPTPTLAAVPEGGEGERVGGVGEAVETDWNLGSSSSSVLFKSGTENGGSAGGGDKDLDPARSPSRPTPPPVSASAPSSSSKGGPGEVPQDGQGWGEGGDSLSLSFSSPRASLIHFSAPSSEAQGISRRSSAAHISLLPLKEGEQGKRVHRRPSHSSSVVQRQRESTEETDHGASLSLVHRKSDTETLGCLEVGAPPRLVRVQRRGVVPLALRLAAGRLFRSPEMDSLVETLKRGALLLSCGATLAAVALQFPKVRKFVNRLPILPVCLGFVTLHLFRITYGPPFKIRPLFSFIRFALSVFLSGIGKGKGAKKSGGKKGSAPSLLTLQRRSPDNPLKSPRPDASTLLPRDFSSLSLTRKGQTRPRGGLGGCLSQQREEGVSVPFCEQTGRERGMGEERERNSPSLSSLSLPCDHLPSPDVPSSSSSRAKPSGLSRTAEGRGEKRTSRTTEAATRPLTQTEDEGSRRSLFGAGDPNLDFCLELARDFCARHTAPKS